MSLNWDGCSGGYFVGFGGLALELVLIDLIKKQLIEATNSYESCLTTIIQTKSTIFTKPPPP